MSIASMNEQAGETEGVHRSTWISPVLLTTKGEMITPYHPEILTSPGWSIFGYRKWSIFGCFFHINVGNWTHDENSMQISADCLGLDVIGNVFEIILVFFPENVNEMNSILEDLKVNDIFMVSGIYTIIWEEDEKSIIIYGPEYAPASFHFPEEEIREAFRRNSKRLEDIADESAKE